jgi:hypothetical protein
VQPSYDRLVDLRFEILEGEQQAAARALLQVDAEEGKSALFKTTVRFPADVWAASSARARSLG